MTTLLMSRFRQLAAALLLSLFVALPAADAMAQAPKIAFVDLQRALNEVAEGKKAKARLKKDFAAKQKKLDAMQKKLMSMKEDFEKQQMMLSEDAKRQKAAEFQTSMIELQQTYAQLQKELATDEAKATSKIFEKMNTIVASIAKEKGYDMVLERTESALLYAKPSMDVTDELIRRYDGK